MSTPMTSEAEILFERRGRAGIVTLNRPKALNALSLGMVRQMHPQLAAWAEDEAVAHVVIRAAGEKAFCAGGDIRQLREWGLADDPAVIDFYREEYRLNTFIKRYPKPYVALIDGIVMGGGVGLSVHGSHRIAGARTIFAMPEAGIGFFPDVGATWFLPRLPGFSGTWLALTGARLGQADIAWCGIATQCLAAGRFDEVVDALAAADRIEPVLAAFADAPQGEAALPALMPVIDRCFSGDTLAEILGRLDAEQGEHAGWAAAQAETIRTRSPTSLAIALRQMREGVALDFEECMRTEFRIVNRVVKGRDFFEGVRAVIVDKDNAPRWQPSRVEDVEPSAIDAYFAPLGEELDLAAPGRP